MKVPFVELTDQREGKKVSVNPNNITYIVDNDDERGKFTFIYFNSEKDHVIPVTESFEVVTQKIKAAYDA
jgi:hypothetical protein